mmetsp:Transcript_12546/g.12162  ORF Transcript_12546/g.12162 Transcript_12546/m.12162 type:complete len:87 (+) Transcript_12546:83-343(+)
MMILKDLLFLTSVEIDSSHKRYEYTSLGQQSDSISSLFTSLDERVSDASKYMEYGSLTHSYRYYHERLYQYLNDFLEEACSRFIDS